MTGSGQRLDVLLIVPFQPFEGYVMEPVYRQTLGAYFGAPLFRATAEFEQFLGHPLDFRHWQQHPLFRADATRLKFRFDRSLTAVALATHLEKQGLHWAAIDPGEQSLAYWRRHFEKMRGAPPRAVAISTSYVMTGSWTKALCALVRRTLPDSKLLVGGSFYTSEAREFFSLDADVFCIGEGEHRLPQMVKAIRDGRRLDNIPGLYLRGGDGALTYTGHVAPLNLDELAQVDWSLAKRIEPPLDPRQQGAYYHVETQRGCLFRCRFCTYHTLTAHEQMSAENAVEAMLRTSIFPQGYIFLVDATASFPRQRWQEILQRLIERGGAPHPILAFARVTDISEEIAELMARAGVQEVHIGQEAGDQRLLNAMKKGTKVEHVASAVRALGKFGIDAQFCFIHGFPGETDESLSATRSMIVSLNRGFETRPVVYYYLITPFHVFDFAPVARQADMQHVCHPMGYDSAEFGPRRACEETLATIIAASRVEHAPLYASLFEGQGHFLFTVSKGPHRFQIFRWLKALERGVAIFLERDLDGRKPDLAELRRLREMILADNPAGWPLQTALFRMKARMRAQGSRLAAAEWAAEKQSGPGWRSRSYAAFCAYRDLGRLPDVLDAWKSASYPELGSRLGRDVPTIERLSAGLIQIAGVESPGHGVHARDES